MSAIHVTLAPDGPRLSRIVAGLMNLSQWNMTPAERLRWIEACLDLGITTFDHADIYGGYTCEALFGAALALRPALRQQMQLVTKCGIALVTPIRPNHRVKHYNTTRAHLVASAEASLRHLHTDVIDLLLIHRPDPLLDPHAVAEAFAALHAAGKVRHFGVSNFTPAQFDMLAAHCSVPLVTNQVEASVLALDPLHDGTFDHALRAGYRPMAWSPVGGGAVFRGDSPRAARVQVALRAAAATHDAAGDQVALAWLMNHPAGVLPVLGTSRLDRLASAVAAVPLTLERQTWYAIWEASAGHEVP